jgi:hypothetical protein
MSGSAPEPRRGMPEVRLEEAEYKRRFLAQYADPAFRALDSELGRVAQTSWGTGDWGLGIGDWGFDARNRSFLEPHLPVPRSPTPNPQPPTPNP